MPRALRVEYPGAIYHVMNRGDRWEPIFRHDAEDANQSNKMNSRWCKYSGLTPLWGFGFRFYADKPTRS
jgi:hypothetical protein